MTSSFGGDRWTCGECSMRNKPWRDVCFGQNCWATKKEEEEEASITAATIVSSIYNNIRLLVENDEEETRRFKDENGNVIARLTESQAQRVRADLGIVTEGLNNYAASVIMKHENTNREAYNGTRRNCQLQQKMRKGTQQKEDFDDRVALAGYARRKFAIRAMISLQLFRSFFAAISIGTRNNDIRYDQLQRRLLSDDDDASSQLISIGGGPANDLYGAVLFERHCYGTFFPNNNRLRRFLSTTLHNFDLSPCWAPIVDQVSLLNSNRSIAGSKGTSVMMTSQTCNLLEPLVSAANRELANLINNNNDDSTSTYVRIFLFSYVINEVMKTPFGDTPPLLDDLIQAAQQQKGQQQGYSTIFLFREPNTASLLTIVARYAGTLEFMELDYGGYGLVLPQ
jgi:hypothetical protein